MRANERFNLADVSVLLIDDNPQALDIVSSVVQGFGVGSQTRCQSTAAAMEIVAQQPIDLILADCVMPEMDGCDFVRWLRRESPEDSRETPVIMLMGYAPLSTVEKTRDCGASYIVTKPLAPTVLLQRILWLGTSDRTFIVSEGYVGPDRRVRNFGPPPNMPGRREGDLSADVGMAVEPNMDQAAIDMLMKPQRVAI